MTKRNDNNDATRKLVEELLATSASAADTNNMTEEQAVILSFLTTRVVDFLHHHVQSEPKRFTPEVVVSFAAALPSAVASYLAMFYYKGTGDRLSFDNYEALADGLVRAVKDNLVIMGDALIDQNAIKR